MSTTAAEPKAEANVPDPETIQSLIIKHQDAFRNLRNNSSSERELRNIRRSIAELAFKQKSLYDTSDDRDNNADEIDAIVLRTIEDMPDKIRDQAIFLRRLDLLLVDAARALEAKREARKRRRTALNATIVTTASGRTELMKRRTTRPLRSTFVPGGGDLLKPGLFDPGVSSILRGSQFDLGYSMATNEHPDADVDVLDIDIAVSAAKMRMRRCKICHAGGEVECCSRCDAGYHVGICVPSNKTSAISSSRSFICPDCSKKIGN